MAFCGVSLPAALNRIRIMQRTRLAMTTFVSAFAAGVRYYCQLTLRSMRLCPDTVTRPSGSFAGVPAASTSVLSPASLVPGSWLAGSSIRASHPPLDLAAPASWLVSGPSGAPMRRRIHLAQKKLPTPLNTFIRLELLVRDRRFALCKKDSLNQVSWSDRHLAVSVILKTAANKQTKPLVIARIKRWS